MKNYTIGLDIGTNSVGWAVIKDDLTLVRKKIKISGNTDKKEVKKNLWGSFLFEEGDTAQDTRVKRIARRRYERRRFRIRELQKIFDKSMREVDSNFFHRLDESFLVEEDKEYSKYPIFSNEKEDKNYYDKYPTIYHLRKDLADSNQKADLRLIYLALAHMIKYRGHFLIEGDLKMDGISISESFQEFIDSYNEVCALEDENLEIIYNDELLTQIENIFKQDISRSKKLDQAIALFQGVKRQSLFGIFLTLIVGNKANFQKIFNLEDDIKLDLKEEDYDENLEELLSNIDEGYRDVFLQAKNVYNAIELSKILKTDGKETKAPLSAQMVELYNQHREDLKKYKDYIKAYLPEKYGETFKDATKNGYAGYIDGKTSQEDFYKFVKAQLKGEENGEYFLEAIENENFLRKQRSFYNGVIPYQIHLQELTAVLDQQEKHYSFLKENRDKIISLLTFRIPYYVGPLAKGESRFAWLERSNSEEKIKPWNFDKIVDTDKSAELFIENLTSRDTYLPDEPVLPKRSLIYQKFTIFNELTKISYIDERGILQNFSSREKIAIFNDLFKNKSKVTKNQLVKYIENKEQIIAPEIKGIEDSFNSNYSTYIDLSKIPDMKKLLEKDEDEILEEIIKILTIFEDRKMRKRQLMKFKDKLSEKAINQLSKKHYTGWGQLSEKLINGIRDEQSNKTILDYLIEDNGCPKNMNRNFMQLINDDTLSFKEKIRKAQDINQVNDIKEIVKDLPGSPAIKKGIYQSIRIVDEIIRKMKDRPKNIVIEMARENQTTQEGKNKSKARLKKIQEGLENLDSVHVEKQALDEEMLKSPKYYLYCLQNGKDIYTGKDLDIGQLQTYDIDHIIPRSFITDNSFDNLVLTSSTVNRGKLDNVPSPDIVRQQKGFWKQLLRAGLMSQRKFNNLTKGKLTDRDRQQFINRQLVETRQITKHVANLLSHHLNEKKEVGEINIVLLKSALTSQFRKKFDFYKVREVNDYHHAHDAYLNGVIALKLLELYPYMAKDLIYGKYSYHRKIEGDKATQAKYKMSNIIERFSQDLLANPDGEIAWEKDKDLNTIRKVLSSKQINIIKKAEEGKGRLFKETINSRPSKKTEKRIPIKNNLDPNIYGGYIEEKMAYYIAINYLENGKTKKAIVGISIKDKKDFEGQTTEYLGKIGFNKASIINSFKNYTLFELENGSRRMIVGASKENDSKGELQKGNQMYLPQNLLEFVYHLKHYNEDETSHKFIVEHKAYFDELLNYIVEFANKYLELENSIEKIKDLYHGKGPDVEEKELVESFINLLAITKCGPAADITFLGEKISRKRYRSTNCLWGSEVIFQSPTGLYETRLRLE